MIVEGEMWGGVEVIREFVNEKSPSPIKRREEVGVNGIIGRGEYVAFDGEGFGFEPFFDEGFEILEGW